MINTDVIIGNINDDAKDAKTNIQNPIGVENIDDNPKHANANIEEPSDSVQKETNLGNTLSAFEQAFSKLFVWLESKEEEGGEWRIHKNYRPLFAYLTPRQIKAFLRGRLLAATEKTTATGNTNENNSPELVLLKTLFHPVWKLHRDAETPTFKMLAHAAKSALFFSYQLSSSGESYNKLAAPASEFFFHQFQFIAQTSNGILTPKDVDACWPAKNEERAVLLHLLKLWLDKDPVTSMPSVSSPSAPSPLVSLSSTPSPSFANWVFRELGVKLGDGSVSEQVSLFQDLTLARQRQGDKRALKLVAEYAERFLPLHSPYFDASSASSLSNLAVIIDDSVGHEKACDDLFQKAMELARPGSRIPLFYVEFLLDVLEDRTRCRNLQESRGKNKDEIIEFAKGILAKSASESLEQEDIFYAAILEIRLKCLGDEYPDRSSPASRENIMRMIWEDLLPEHAKVLIGGGREPVSRLNDLLDAVIGTSGVLRIKEPLQAAVWGAQVANEKPGWTMAIQIANDLVGESGRGTDEEKAGMKLNAMLVANEELLRANENYRMSGIWRQSATAIGYRNGKSAQSRIALAFLMSMAYGGTISTRDRMQRMWARIENQETRTGTEQDWTSVLTFEHREIAERINENEWNHDFAKEIRDAVFGEEYAPFVEPRDLANFLEWNAESFKWAGKGKTFDDVVDKILAFGRRDERGTTSMSAHGEEEE
jgi:hypothetical protein